MVLNKSAPEYNCGISSFDEISGFYIYMCVLYVHFILGVLKKKQCQKIRAQMVCVHSSLHGYTFLKL